MQLTYFFFSTKSEYSYIKVDSTSILFIFSDVEA